MLNLENKNKYKKINKNNGIENNKVFSITFFEISLVVVSENKIIKNPIKKVINLHL